ncbi:AbrB/MazE/SpoVT family DNA-binding domain-containing protein [Enterococcus sp. LJL90]
MTKITVNNWGNSLAIRIPKDISQKFNVENGDKLNIEIKDNQLIITHTVEEEKTLTFEELFADYNGESFKTELIDFGESTGNEQW